MLSRENAHQLLDKKTFNKNKYRCNAKAFMFKLGDIYTMATSCSLALFVFVLYSKLW